jgi:hypothetical protein
MQDEDPVIVDQFCILDDGTFCSCSKGIRDGYHQDIGRQLEDHLHRPWHVDV